MPANDSNSVFLEATKICYLKKFCLSRLKIQEKKYNFWPKQGNVLDLEENNFVILSRKIIYRFGFER